MLEVKYNLFTQKVFDASVVVGAESVMTNELNLPELESSVSELLAGIKNQTIDCSSVDTYALSYFIALTSPSLIARHGWKVFVVQKDDLMTCKSLPDIGSYIRSYLLGRPETHILFRMLHFSMPFVKHNRLSMPSLQESLWTEMYDVVMILIAFLLGIYNPSDKRPSWRMRVYLIGFCHRLLTKSSAADLHAFCNANIFMIRLAMTDYFMYFLTNNLPLELDALRKYKIASLGTINTQLRFIINAFKQEIFCKSVFDWNTNNTLALHCLERCNRSSKEKVKSLCLFKPNLKTVNLSNLSVHHLPIQIKQQQFEFIQSQLMLSSSGISNMLNIHVCTRCQQPTFKRIDNKMRLTRDFSACCSQCESSKSVIKIDTCGKIVKINNIRFYFCVKCQMIHEWLGCGTDFQSNKVAQISETGDARKCLLCSKKTHNGVNVVDLALGLNSCIQLCWKHYRVNKFATTVTDIRYE